MANKPRKPAAAPVPRDHADASMSELMPFRSSKIKLWKSPLFYLLLIAGGASVLMFGMGGAIIGSPNAQGFGAYMAFVILTVFVILLMLQMSIYAYARSDRSIWPFMIAYVVVCVQMMTPIIQPYFFVFRKLLPGDIQITEQTPFLTAFVSMWFGAGMMEELLKGVPILLGAWLAVNAAKHPQWTSKPWFRLLQVRGPLDGVLMGAFAGAAFIFIETATQYVPMTAMNVAKQSDYGTGLAAGLLLLVPRVIGGASHIAYSIIFGYFIGLGVIRPRQFWKLVGIGYLASCLIHALWNSVGQISPMLYWVVSLAGAIIAGAMILKARQIDASELGRENFSSGSILVERSPAAPAARPTGNIPPVPSPAPAAAPRASASADGRPLALDVEGLIIPLRGGSAVDLGVEPALGGRGQGVSGQVVPHPTRANVLGLRNTGAVAWTARLRNGSQQTIANGQNVRLADGVQIDFGGVSGRVVQAG